MLYAFKGESVAAKAFKETERIGVSGTSHADVRGFLPHAAQHGGRISVH